MRQIKEIIIHCSATKEGIDFRARDIDRWHKEKGWSGIGYHFVIRLDGEVENGRPIEKVGAHCKGHNANSIGICYIGGLNKDGKPADTRTVLQKASLFNLIGQLRDTYGNIPVHSHNYYDNNKACPSFDADEEYN